MCGGASTAPRHRPEGGSGFIKQVLGQADGSKALLSTHATSSSVHLLWKWVLTAQSQGDSEGLVPEQVRTY